MSRQCTLSAIVAVLAFCAALVAGCGATPTALPAAESTGEFSSPTPPRAPKAVATVETAEILIVDTPTGVASPPAPPGESPTVRPSATHLPTTLASDTPFAPTPQPSDTPHPPTVGPAPQILLFTANPTITQNVGDAVHLTWEASGLRAELCPLIATGPVGCQDVPLAGGQAVVVDEQALTYVGFALRVYDGDATAVETVELHPQCQNLRQWFFANPPLRCPSEEALISYAAAQYFEHGWMIWIEETDEFYVFYDELDERGFQVVQRVVGLELKPGASEDNRVGEDPPPGLYQPVSGFGLVWRGEVYWPYQDSVRERLGWATAPEFGLETAYQCSVPAHPRLWSCFLLAPEDDVIRLHPDSTAGVRILWEVW